jgi:hypothetical protein
MPELKSEPIEARAAEPAPEPPSDLQALLAKDRAQTEAYRKRLDPPDMMAALKLADLLSDSGLFGIKGPQDALARIMMGSELGLSAMMACKGIYSFDSKNGRDMGPYAEVMEAVCIHHPDFEGMEWLRSDDTGATLVIQRRGRKPMTFSFTEEDARRAELLEKDNWKHHPRRMYRARCRSEGWSTMFPDATRGFKSAEELYDGGGTVNDTARGIMAALPKADEPTKAQHESMRMRVDLLKTAIKVAGDDKAKRKLLRLEIEAAERSKELVGPYLIEARTAWNAGIKADENKTPTPDAKS